MNPEHQPRPMPPWESLTPEQQDAWLRHHAHEQRKREVGHAFRDMVRGLLFLYVGLPVLGLGALVLLFILSR